jgi:hypothetical protein
VIDRLLARWRNRPDKALATLIVPPRVVFAGFDPSLRERTLAKREREDRARKAANRIASTPAASGERWRVVGGER